MVKLNNPLLICFILLCASFNEAQAQQFDKCFNAVDNRLKTYCASTAADNEQLTPDQLVVLDYQLKKIGRSFGLGIAPNIQPSQKPKFNISPALSYEPNINGGNPDKVLELGGFVFSGDPNLIKKAGTVLGINGNVSGWRSLGDKKYLEYSLSLSRSSDLDFKHKINRVTGNVCSIAQASDNWFFDLCGSLEDTSKELSSNQNKTISLAANQLSSNRQGSFSLQSYSVKNNYEDAFEQLHYSYSKETVRKNGATTSIGFTVGEDVRRNLALKRAVEVTASLQIAHKWYKLSLNRKYYDGGILMGINRDDDVSTLSLSIPLKSKLILSVGYSETDSSINYYDANEVFASLRLGSFQF